MRGQRTNTYILLVSDIVCWVLGHFPCPGLTLLLLLLMTMVHTELTLVMLGCLDACRQLMLGIDHGMHQHTE